MESRKSKSVRQKAIQYSERSGGPVKEPSGGITWHNSSKSQDIAVCSTKESHPLHTFRVNSLCNDCEAQRQQKIAIFELKMITESVERSLFRSLSEIESPRLSNETKKRRTITLETQEKRRRKKVEGYLNQGEDEKRQIRGVIPLLAGHHERADNHKIPKHDIEASPILAEDDPK